MRHRRAARRDVPRARRVHRPGHRRGDAHREGAARVPEPERRAARRAARHGAHPRRSRSWRPTEVLAVPRSAVEQVEGKTGRLREDRRRRSSGATCCSGRRAAISVEIRKGLNAGEVVAVDGAFLLKSELLR